MGMVDKRRQRGPGKGRLELVRADGSFDALRAGVAPVAGTNRLTSYGLSESHPKS